MRQMVIQSSAIKIAFESDASALTPGQRRRLLDRSTSSEPTVRTRTGAIIDRVRRDGDGALFALGRELDGVSLEALEVPRASCRRALDALEPGLRRALERCAANVARAHRAFLPVAQETET